MDFTVDTLQRLTNEALDFEAFVVERIEGFEVVYSDGNELKQEPIDNYIRDLAELTRAIRDSSPAAALVTPKGAHPLEACAAFADRHGFPGTSSMIEEAIENGDTDEQIAGAVLAALRSERDHSADREGDAAGYDVVIEYLEQGRDL